MTLTEEMAASWFSYDPETGVLTRKRDAASNAKAGPVTPYLSGGGYPAVGCMGKGYRIHRIAFLLMTGSFPSEDVDHINGDRTDNRWANLRLATRKENCENQRVAHRNSKTGLLGASPFGNKFKAQIKHNHRVIHIGTFVTAEEAHAAYLEAKRSIHTFSTIQQKETANV